MLELPDFSAYITAVELLILGEPLKRVRISSPFLLRTVDPPITSVEGRRVHDLRRIGKRIAIGVEGHLWLVLHLMIAGRLHWRSAGTKVGWTQSTCSFRFPERFSCAYGSRGEA